MTIRITGIDLALTKTGVARADGRFTTFKPTNDGYRRHWQVAERLAAIVEHDQTDVVVMEDYSHGGPGGQRVLIALAEIGGIARVMFTGRHLPFALVRPKCLKAFATGNGNASKAEVYDAALGELEGADIDYRPTNEDEADAFWLRAMGRAHYTPDTLTRRERATRAIRLQHLQVVEWPELTP